MSRAANAGVLRLVEIADGPEEWSKALSLARARPRVVRAALGLHPYHADRFSEELFLNLKRLVLFPEVVAIGEIGLDYVKSTVPADVQRSVFERLLILCRETRKPCVIHCRQAFEDLIPIIRNVYPQALPGHFWGVIHCFSGLPPEAALLKEAGFALGVDGPVTYPKNDALREALRGGGIENLVLETDSPYLPPQSSRGKRNEPSSIPEIAAKVAQTFSRTLEDVAKITTQNAERLFSLSAQIQKIS